MLGLSETKLHLHPEEKTSAGLIETITVFAELCTEVKINARRSGAMKINSKGCNIKD